MDFHGIDTKGKNWLERLNGLPAWEPRFEGRIVYDMSRSTLSFGTSGGWIDIASFNQGGISNPAVPVGAIVLFESDTALAGYTLLTDQDDDVVYITKGSGAGGEAGGTAKAGSTWTQDGHALTTAEMPPHTHAPGSAFTYFIGYKPGAPTGTGGTNIGYFGATASAGSGSAHSHGSSWRPKGRNWTRQQKT